MEDLEDLKESPGGTIENRNGEEMINNFLNFNNIVNHKNDEEDSQDSLMGFRKKENNSVPKESIKLIENFYMSILNDYDNQVILNNFTLIYDLYSSYRNVLFLAFWFPYIKQNEEIYIQIFKKTKIFCKNNEIKEINTNTYSISVLSTFVFQLALTHNFNDKLLSLILSQGKIKIPIEWILEKIINKDFEVVEKALNGGNDCTISSRVLINIVSEQLDSNENFKGIIKNRIKKSFARFSSIKSKSTFGNNNQNSQKSLNILSDKDYITNGKEITVFLLKGTGKLSITKLLIFVSLINYYHKEITETKNEKMEEFNVEKLLRTVCLFDRKEKRFSNQILKGLYLINQKKIARELLDAKLLTIDIKLFRTSIKYNDLKFTLKFYQLYKYLEFYENEKLHVLIMANIFIDTDNIEIYLYLLKNFINSNLIKINSLRLFLKITEDLMQLTGKENELFTNFYNPVKIFILFAEVLNIIKLKFPLLSYNVTRLVEMCLYFSENLLNLVKEDESFREIILEKDLINRTLLDIISDNHFLTILKVKLVEKVVEDLWKGPYFLEGSFLETSYNYKSLKAIPDASDYDTFTKMRSELSEYTPEHHKTNFTPFKVWRNNISIKYNLELFVTFILLGFFQIISLFIVDKYQSVLNVNTQKLETLGNVINNFLYQNSNLSFESVNGTFPIRNPEYFILIKTCNSSFLEDPTNINEARDLYLDIFNDKAYFVNKWMLILIGSYRLFYILPATYIVRLIYHIKFKKPEYGLTMLSDVLLVLSNVLVRIFLNYQYLYTIIGIREELNDDKVNCFEFLPDFSNNFNLISGDTQWKNLLILSLVCGMLWLRFILLLRGTKIMGPIIVIFFFAADGIKYYLFIFFTVTFAYSCFAYLNFYNVHGLYFKNILMTVYYYTVVSTGGDPNYDIFLNATTSNPSPMQVYVPVFGAILIFVILVFNTIAFFNIIIAYLTNIFDKYSADSQQLFIQKKIEIRRKFLSENPKFDSLLVSVYPFETFTLPFAFLMLFSKSEKTLNCLNKTILSINFLLFSFCYCILYLVFNAVLIPLSYLKVIYSKFLQIFINDPQNYFLIYKIFSFLCYIAFGLLLHLYQYFIDFIIFLKELRKDKIPLKTDNENSGKFKIKISLLKLILSILLNLDEDTTCKLHIEKFLDIFITFLYREVQVRHEEVVQFFDKYNQEKEKPLQINEDFNIYVNQFESKIEKRGVDYLALCDFLSNFCDDKNIIDLTVMKTVLNNYWRNFKNKKFFIKVPIKNYKFQRIKTRAFKEEDEMQNKIKENSIQMKISEISPEPFLTNEVTNQYNNGTFTPLYNKGINGQNDVTTTVNDLIRLRKFSDYFKDFESTINNLNISNTNKIYNDNNSTNTIAYQTQLTELCKINNKPFLMLQTVMNRKLNKIKEMSTSKEFCIIPIIPRSIIYLFLTSLKEFQLDAARKLSDNVFKTQKSIKDLTNKFDTIFGIKSNRNKSQSSLTKLINKNNSNNNVVSTKNGKKLIDNKLTKELSQIEENRSIEENVGSSNTLDGVYVNNKGKNVMTKFFDKNQENKNSDENSDESKISSGKLITDIIIDSPPSSSSSSKLDTRELIEFREIVKGRTVTESSNREEKLEKLEKRIINLEKNMEDVLTFTKLIYGKLNKNEN